MLNNICLICCDIVCEADSFVDADATIKNRLKINHYFVLLERYLDESPFGREGKHSSNSWRLISELIKNEMIVCEGCSKMVDTFCELYHQMEKVQLLLNWQVRTLVDKMVSVDPTKNFGGRSHVKVESEILNGMMEFKRGIGKRCQRKLKTSFPRVKLADIRQAKKEQDLVWPTPDEEEVPKRNIECGSDFIPVVDFKPELDERDCDSDKDPDHFNEYKVEDVHERDHPLKLENYHVNDENDQSQEEMEVETDEGELIQNTTATVAIEPEINETLRRGTFNRETFKHKCNYCDKEFVSRHYKCVHSKVKIMHKCLTCGKGYALRFQYNRHCITAHSRVPIKCNICGEAFQTKFQLRRHQQSHCKEVKVEVPSSPIPVPTSSQSQSETLQVPKGIMDPLSGKINCDKCPKTFMSNRGFGLHYSSEHLLQRFICPICDQSYKSKIAYLRHHDVVHEGIRFTCQNCNKSFTEKNKLRVHELHCGSVPKVTQYQKCQICEKEVARGALRHHMKYVHLNVRNHLCSHCGKGFVSSGDMRKHVKNVHLQLREHLCDSCGKGFTTNSNLRIHRRKIHSITG